MELERMDITPCNNLVGVRIEKEVTTLVVCRVANKDVVLRCKLTPTFCFALGTTDTTLHANG